MKNKRFDCFGGGVSTLTGVAMLVFVVGLVQAQIQPPSDNQPECINADGTPNLDVPSVAANCPDVFAWMKFIEVNAPASGNPDSVFWQTWATDPNTFPAKPEPSECGKPDSHPEHCPTWPKALTGPQMLATSKRNPDLHPPDVAATVLAKAQAGTGVPKDLGAVAGETIRRNGASFDYIVEHDLWYQEGLAKRFTEDFKVEFPIDAIELKLNWLAMDHVHDPSRYFTVETKNGIMGLVAMHITTKDLPSWFWATFEHVDNPGRCDYIGCWDAFGVDPAHVPPRNELKTTYPPGKLNPALLEMMKAGKLNRVFQNYRLKGSQINFTDSMGEPTLLGNSVTEYGFVPTASCMTCHGRAGVDWNGKKPANLRIFGEKLGGQTFNGPLDPELFYDRNSPMRRYMMQVDFIWAIPFRAQSIGGNQE